MSSHRRVPRVPADEPELRNGRMRDTIEHTVHSGGREAEVGSDDEILFFQELGTENMPPRSILGGAAARVAEDVVAELSRGTIRYLVRGL